MSEQIGRDDLDRMLDRALDAMAAEQAPPANGDEEYMDLVDTARIVRRLRRPQMPDDSFASQLAENLWPQIQEGSQNGRASIAEFESTRAVRTRSSRSRWLLASCAALLRVLGAGVIAGALAGLIAIGVGGRIAMRISGALYLRDHPGSTSVTDSSGQTVGVITLTGTIDFLTQGMFAGVLGGVTYVIVRQWLPAGHRARPLATGAFLLCATGIVFIDRSNPDFSRIGIPWLNVLMFSTFVALFGYLLALAAERLLAKSRPTPTRKPSRLRHALGAIIIYPAGLFGLLVLASMLLSVGVTSALGFIEVVIGSSNRLLLLAQAVLALLVFALPLLSVASRQDVDTVPAGSFRYRIHEHRDSFQHAGQLILLLASATGLCFLLYTIFVILEG